MFNIGDTIYYATCRYQPISFTCPICDGNLKVTLILGNGDSVELPCQYCKRGYEGPYGVVSEYNYLVDGELHTITSISSEISGEGEKRCYHSGSYCLDEDKCFATKKEAVEAAKAIKAQLDEDQRTRVEHLKHDAKKSFSWNAGYHLREAKNLRKRALYHDEMAILCKNRITNKTEG